MNWEVLYKVMKLKLLELYVRLHSSFYYIITSISMQFTQRRDKGSQKKMNIVRVRFEADVTIFTATHNIYNEQVLQFSCSGVHKVCSLEKWEQTFAIM